MTTIRGVLERMGEAHSIELTRVELTTLLERWDAREEERYRLSEEGKALRAELARVGSICRPLWRAAQQVRDAMRRAMRAARAEDGRIPADQVMRWEAELSLQLRQRRTDFRR